MSTRYIKMNDLSYVFLLNDVKLVVSK